MRIWKRVNDSDRKKILAGKYCLRLNSFMKDAKWKKKNQRKFKIMTVVDLTND